MFKLLDNFFLKKEREAFEKIKASLPTHLKENNMENYIFTFTDRDSYISWRNEWRQNYQELSYKIYRLKRARCDKQRRNVYAGEEQSNLVLLRNDARIQMEIRNVSKLEAKKQYELNKSRIMEEIKC
jgi:murein L,D-transpeptidase YafK